jgi:hypothetical protein
MYDERHARTALKGTVFATTQSTCGRMLAYKFLGTIGITVIKHWAIVTCKYYECILKHALFIERTYYLTYAPVELRNGIATQAH